MRDVLDILKTRGLVEAVTDEGLQKKLCGGPVTLYAGFDPTSSSLQIGNFAAIMVLAHFQRCGHKVVAVVGAATGMIGDPSGKSSERTLLSAEEVERNAVGVKENLSRFLDFKHPTAPAMLVNNHDWMKEFTFVDFLRDVGKHFRLGAMLAKESVKARLNSEAGMSFAEFSYQLLQAYDFLHLYDKFGCTLQVGGSDQWGNITAGIDLIRKLRGADAYGVTFQLVCDSAGRKFGKSEGNAIYLDAAKTSCYDFYQFFFRVEDVDVGRMLKIFTFLPLDEIESLEAATRKAPEERVAQRRLAEEVTRMVHGEAGLTQAGRASRVLFGESMDGLRADELLGVLATVPSTEMARDHVAGVKICDLAAAAGVCGSKGEARRLVQNNGLYVNNRRVAAPDAVVADSDIVDGRLVVFRTGKRNFHLVKVV